MEKTADSASIWEKAKSISAVLAATLIPLSIAWLGHIYAEANSSREVALKYVELAVSILKETPSEKNKEVRDWAVALVNEHSKVKLTAAARAELQAAPLISSGDKAELLLRMRWEAFKVVLMAGTSRTVLDVEKIAAAEAARLKDLPLEKQMQEIQRLELEYLRKP